MWNSRKKVTAVFLSLGLSLILSKSAFSEDFIARVDSEMNQPLALTRDQLSTLNDIQYIFVDGTFGEVFNTNFAPALTVIANEWPGAETAVIRPYTPNTIPVNADLLFHQISFLRQTSHKSKAVIVAHSKGAAEVGLMAILHPEMISQYGVIAFGLVSAPMGGTDVIDYLQTFTCKIGAPFCRVLNDQFPFLATFVPSIIVPIFSEALAGVSDEARGNFENEFFYVRTQMEDSDVTSPLYATHLYLSFHQGEPQNDGLIPTAHEMLWENTSGNSRLLGTDLGVMIGDHNSLLNKAMLPSTDLYRQAFFRALVERMLFGAVQ